MKTFIHNRHLIRKLHYISGITLSTFIAFHLLNHLFSLAGPSAHIEVMDIFRKVYRHPVVEAVLLAAVFFQIVTGTRLLFSRNAKTVAEKIQVYSGMYLSFFLLIHVAAVLSGRYMEQLDTNFYYAAAGLNNHPATFFFIPYYFLSVVAISLHVAAVHYLKTRSAWMAYGIAAVGIIVSTLIIIGFTDTFQWLNIPVEYQLFIDKYFGE